MEREHDEEVTFITHSHLSLVHLEKNEIGSKKHASALFALFLEVAARSGDFFIPPTH